jgi:hypothetical protein
VFEASDEWRDKLEEEIVTDFQKDEEDHIKENLR